MSLIEKAYSHLFELHGSSAWQPNNDDLITFFRQSDQTSATIGRRQASTFKILAVLSGHGDAPHLAANLRNYIAGFSTNMREVLEKFDFDNTFSKLDEAGLLFQVLERFGLNLGSEHRVALGQMMEKLDEDAGLDAAARVNTRENVWLTFDQKVEHVIQEIVDSNFEIYKRITDDRAFGEAVKNFLFD